MVPDLMARSLELPEIVGPVGPRLVASELHPIIWSAAAKLWDDGHIRPGCPDRRDGTRRAFAEHNGPGTSGENLAIVFSPNDPTPGSPRLRLRDIDPTSKTWKSAHEGAAALVWGAFIGVRNLVSHPGWPDPSPCEGIEMLAVLSYVAHLIERSDAVKSP